MISNKLDIAIREAIQAHAQNYQRGVVDAEKAVFALGEVAANLLTAIPELKERATMFRVIVNGLAGAVHEKSNHPTEGSGNRQEKRGSPSPVRADIARAGAVVAGRPLPCDRGETMTTSLHIRWIFVEGADRLFSLLPADIAGSTSDRGRRRYDETTA